MKSIMLIWGLLRHSLAKWPIFPHLKHGPFCRGRGVSVWATFPYVRLWKLRLVGALVLAEVSMATGVLFIHLGALVEL